MGTPTPEQVEEDLTQMLSMATSWCMERRFPQSKPADDTLPELDSRTLQSSGGSLVLTEVAPQTVEVIRLT
ncbi:hypothetical protein NDU88_003129 [Pleurodeles waltl]|uniref:Uncharacterized protein n=1 Tax=Pleurodeles waltl TaxID=8319 RepID=A0AAV7VGK9_PLEWA|nr:hypothetical protein NDU88_003129 [Pleurodeles waltl]